MVCPVKWRQDPRQAAGFVRRTICQPSSARVSFGLAIEYPMVTLSFSSPWFVAGAAAVLAGLPGLLVALHYWRRSRRARHEVARLRREAWLQEQAWSQSPVAFLCWPVEGRETSPKPQTTKQMGSASADGSGFPDRAPFSPETGSPAEPAPASAGGPDAETWRETRLYGIEWLEVLLGRTLPRGQGGQGTCDGALFGAICAALGSPEDADTLRRCVNDLRRKGKGFTLDLAPWPLEGWGGDPWLRVMGWRTPLAPEGNAAPPSAPASDLPTGADIVLFQHDGGMALADRMQTAWIKASNDLKEILQLLDVLPFPVWRRHADLGLGFCNRAYRILTAREDEPETPDTPTGEAQETPLSTDPGLGTSPLQRRYKGRDLTGRDLAERAQGLGGPTSESRTIVINGRRHLYDFTEHPLSKAGQESQPAALVGYALDQSALMDTRSELERHLAAHDGVLERLGAAIEIYGPDKRLKFFNEAFLQMAQLDESWLRGHPSMGEVLEAMRDNRRLPEDCADFRTIKKARLDRFTALEAIEENLFLADGTTWRMTSTPHPLGGLIQTYEELTTQLELERDYHTLAASYRATLDKTFEAVAVFGGDGRLKLFNPAFERLWSLAPMMLAHEPHITDFVANTQHFFDRSASWPDWTNWAIDRIADPKEESGRFERLDHRVIEYRSAPLPDGGVMLSFLDVTEATQEQREQAKRIEALEQADRLKSDIIATLSYELRTPLAAVMGYADMLINQYAGPLPQQQTATASAIHQAAERLLTQVDDVLDLTGTKAGILEAQREEIALRPTLADLLPLLEPRARRNGVTLALDCPADIGRLMLDKRWLRQALFALLVDAIRVTPAGHAITLGARRRVLEAPAKPAKKPTPRRPRIAGTAPRDELRLWVRDGGIGLDHERQARPSLIHRLSPPQRHPRTAEAEPLPLFQHLVEGTDMEPLQPLVDTDLRLDFVDAGLGSVPGAGMPEERGGWANPGEGWANLGESWEGSELEQEGGLGLVLARSFTTLHGGWLEVESDPGQGTTVLCHLPLSPLDSGKAGDAGTGWRRETG